MLILPLGSFGTVYKEAVFESELLLFIMRNFVLYSCAFVATTGQTTTCDGNSMALTFDANYFPDLHMTTEDLYMNGMEAGAGLATGDQGMFLFSLKKMKLF